MHAVFVTATENKAKTLTDAMWIPDSGAICHVTNDKKGCMTHPLSMRTSLLVIGKQYKLALNGKIDTRFDSTEGTSTMITLMSMKFILRFWVNSSSSPVQCKMDQRLQVMDCICLWKETM